MGATYVDMLTCKTSMMEHVKLAPCGVTWIVLLCRHFLETQHTFSMQLGKTQRVWDYIGGVASQHGPLGWV